MNLSQGNPFLVAFSASFEQREVDEVTAAPPLSPVASAAAFFGQRKKFLEPNSISFSSLSKPVDTNQSILLACANAFKLFVIFI